MTSEKIEEMDNLIEIHLAALDGAESPLDRLKRTTSQSISRMLDEAGEVPDLVEARRQTLQAAQIEAISSGRFEFAYRALDLFVDDVRSALTWERANGRLKQYTPFDRVNSWKTELACHGWAAGEKAALVDHLIKGGDEIAAVGWDAIILKDGRTISRTEVRAHVRRENPVSDEHLRHLREAPPPKVSTGSGTGIVDANGKFTEFGAA